MATRSTRLVTKNNSSTGTAFPSGGNALQGEAVVNLYDGILAYSGATGGGFTTNNNGTSGYFEVGSNLYDLKIRNQITAYSGVTNLEGYFLSGTSTGFVLQPTNLISGSFTSFSVTGDTGTGQSINDSDTLNIAGGTGIDTVVGATDTITVSIDATVATSSNTLAFFAPTTSAQLAGVISDETGSGQLVFNTGATLYSPTINTSIAGDITNGGNITTTNYLIGATASQTLTNKTIDATNNTLNNLFTFSGDSGTVETINGTENIVFSGGANIVTTSSAGNVITIAATGLGTMSSFTVAGDTGGGQSITDGNTLSILGGTGIDTVDSATDTVTISIDGSVATSANTLDFFSSTTSAQLASVISDETGTGVVVFGTDPTITFTSETNRIVHTDGSGVLTTTAGLTFDGTNTVLPGSGSLTVGTGGLVVGSGGDIDTPGTGDVTIHGNLTIFGDSVSALTTNLYAEDPQIIINYNPTGDTLSTSVNSGIIIQAGNGVASGDVNLTIAQLSNLTGLTANNVPDVTEYGGLTGSTNRGFITQLNDIVIRSTDATDATGANPGAVNGVRVLAEFDILDGGSY